MESLATTLTQAVDGLSRLGQAEFKYVATSLAVSALPDDIRSSWEDKTESSNSTEELIAFLRRKADNPMYRDQAGHSRPTERRGVKHQPSKQKGLVNVLTTQPQPRASPPPPVQTPNVQPQQRSRGSQVKIARGSQYSPCRYQCKLCTDNHYVYACSNFQSMSVPQRKEHARANSLRSNCLKPGHSSA